MGRAPWEDGSESTGRKAMRVQLEITAGPFAGKRLDVTKGQTVLIGRSDRATFPIPHDPYLSSRHFLLECNSRECLVRDLNSTNGTWLNSRRIQESPLLDGDVIVAGTTGMRVTIRAEAGARAGAVPQIAGSSATLPGKDLAGAAQVAGRQNSIRDRISPEDQVPLATEESTEEIPSDVMRSLPAWQTPPQTPE
jgi:pSer/pThr/pTyr-binding forkhead associated (FHA) protein